MLVVFSPIFVTDTKITFFCNFVAPLNHFIWLKTYNEKLGNLSLQKLAQYFINKN